MCQVLFTFGDKQNICLRVPNFKSETFLFRKGILTQKSSQDDFGLFLSVRFLSCLVKQKEPPK